jgi:14-3-3 protein epsilon
MSSEIADLIYLVQVAKELQRHPDMISLMNKVLSISPHLDPEARALLSQIYHDSFVAYRANLSIIEPYLEVCDTPEKSAGLLNLIAKLRAEGHALCVSVVEMVDTILLPASETSPDRLFCLKMKGDYYRYDAEFQVDELRENGITHATINYETALKLAEELEIVDPLRLSLILNYCVFLVDVKGEKERGRTIAQETVDRAEQLIAIKEEQPPDTGICLGLLKDDLKLWSSEQCEFGLIE